MPLQRAPYKACPIAKNDSIVNQLPQTPELYDAVFNPKPAYIAVSTTQEELAVPFNLTIPTTVISGHTNLTTQPAYKLLDDNNGNIDFPVLVICI
jgi:polysaccharide export outer membrane protein